MEYPVFKEYFAALNSGCGFKNYFPAVLSGLKQIIILKGTPGSGKSGIMKKLAASAAENGLDAERIYCSSDTSSLDGVVIRSKGAAVIDGTAPHTADPEYPVVAQSIFNTAEYMDEAMLKEHKDEIIKLSEEKSRRYSFAYRFLSCRSAVREIRHALISAAVLNDKMDAAINRIIKKESKKLKASSPLDSRFDIALRASAAFGGGGLCVKNTFSNAGKIYLIDDKYDIAPLFLSMLISKARQLSLSAVVSPDPFDTNMLCAVYFPQLDVLFAVKQYAPESDSETVTVNTGRFADKELLKQSRTRTKFLSGCMVSFEEAALSEFSLAKENHMQIEKYYTAAMDFKALDNATDNIINKILAD